MEDLQTLKNSIDIADVIGRHVSLSKKGPELVGICPFHDDHKSSLQVNPKKGIFKCFACGEGGDAFDFLTAMGRTLPEAIAEVKGEAGAIAASPKKNKAKAKQAPKLTPVRPKKPPESFLHYRLGEPSQKWLYRHADGHPFGYILRFDTPDGKEIIPYWYASDGNTQKWVFRGFPAPRMLYGAHLLAKHPNAAVLMVEGEKCADAANAQLDNNKTVSVSWQGGANAVGRTDFSQLAGRRLIFWPDNDCEGLSAMLHIAHVLRPQKAKILPLEPAKPKKWDLADQQWTPEAFRQYIKDNMQPLPELGQIYTAKQPERGTLYEFGMKDGKWSYKKVEQPEPDPTIESPKKAEPPKPAKPKRADPAGGYFRFLGYGKNEQGTQSFFFNANRSKQVVRLSASSMTKTNLMTLAPLSWWEDTFPAKSGMSADAAQNWLIENSLEAGLYDPENTRGRGAWMDGDDVIIHTGDTLLVNGQKKELGHYEGAYTYERARGLEFRLSNAASNKEAHRLLDLCTLINWDRPVNAYLLAGWCVIAPVCGALRWRPHIWITGPAGTGKSWIFENIVRRMLGNTCLSVQSETTEAGIRQYLGRDALPVMFDEAEGEDRKAQERIQSVLTLMRGASTSDGGMIIKGSAGGAATRYSVRSCFAYASIGVQLTQASDRSRVSVLSISKKQGEEAAAQWENLQRVYAETMADNFADRLKARTVSILPNILKNADTFSSAAAAYFGDQRAGDQIGTLLAGAYSLVSAGEISYDKALQWITAKEWGDIADEDEKDERRLINTLMEHITIFEVGGKRLERTIGELVKIFAEPGLYAGGEILPENAGERLNRLGFRVDKDKELLIVSNTSKQIGRILADTPWTRNHAGILKRLKGAEGYGPTTFGGHTKGRAVSIPMDSIFG